MMHKRIALLAALAVLPACSDRALLRVMGRATPEQPPIVRGLGGGSASMSIVACEQRPGAIIDALRILMEQSPVVAADENSSARLTIDACARDMQPPAQRSPSR